jgi:hypothetical protein
MMLLLTICNTSCDAADASVIVMNAPIQPLFKVWSAIDHIRHLILATYG